MTDPWGYPDDRHYRERVLQQRISRAVLTTPKDAERYRTDVAMHLQVKVLRDVLLLADKAMAAEGIDREVRDRVVHWILVGEPPPGREQDPDAELDKAVWARLEEREAWTRHLEELPIDVPSLLEDL